MAIPTSVWTASPTIYLSTAGDALAYNIPVATIRWHLTTAASSTWAISITQSTSLASSTVSWPILGTTTASVTLGGSTGAGSATGGYVDYVFNNWFYGVVLVAIGGGFIEVIKGAPGEDWVIRKPAGF